MKTVADLGRLFKKKYPGGEYDDMPDDQVGRRVKQKWPGRYDDFEDFGLGVSASRKSTSRVDAIFAEPEEKKPAPPPEDKRHRFQKAAEEIRNRYFSDSGRIWSWWIRGSSESRKLTEEAFTAELGSLASYINAEVNVENAIRNYEAAKQRWDWQFEIEAFMHRIQLKKLAMDMLMVENATAQNMPLELYLEQRRMQVFDGAFLDRVAKEYRIRMLAAVEGEYVRDIAQLELLQNRLDQIYREVWRLENGYDGSERRYLGRELPDFIQRQIESRNEVARGLENRIRRFFQGDNGAKSGGKVSDTDPSGNLR